MAPKRQSAILPQPKKPRPVAAPKLEDKSASPGLPKGVCFLHSSCEVHNPISGMPRGSSVEQALGSMLAVVTSTNP
ncbi:rCG45635, isoform CRA_d, partial [Rattus norvegicus]